MTYARTWCGDLYPSQCSMPNVSFATKWLFSMGLPLGACTIFLLIHINLYIKKRLVLGRRTKTMTHIDVLIGGCKLETVAEGWRSGLRVVVRSPLPRLLEETCAPAQVACCGFGGIAGMFLTMMYFLYLFLTRSILDIFNCAPTEPSDGHTYLQVRGTPPTAG